MTSKEIKADHGAFDTSSESDEIDVLKEKLKKLANQWGARSLRKFMDAEAEKNQIGRRLIEHGAFCYANAALELRAMLDLD